MCLLYLLDNNRRTRNCDRYHRIGSFMTGFSQRVKNLLTINPVVPSPVAKQPSFTSSTHEYIQSYPIFLIDRMHKWRPKKYSFVFVLISLTSTQKIQKKSCFRTRLVGLISTMPKEYFLGRHLCIRSVLQVLSN